MTEPRTIEPPAHDGWPSAAIELLSRLESRTANIGVVGLGYVGLPLADALHAAGYTVSGFDLDAKKIELLARGESYLHHLGEDLAQRLSASDRFEATADFTRLGDCDAVLLCVPTPLGPHREPDLSYVLNSTELTARTLRPGQLVVLESTTYPGTTRDEMLPLLEAGGLVSGTDFFVAYSPEREDPGRKGMSTGTIPKLVGGLDPVSGALAEYLYAGVISKVHRVASAEVAEAAKLLENIYRAVNIALVNELKIVLGEMDIDVWDVVAAASTKPFGFQPFYPGPGLGGHCIPMIPFYLTWKAKALGLNTRFIELAGEVNAEMPHYVISRIVDALNDDAKAMRGSRILVLGVAYKPDIDDMRESPAADIIELLQERGVEVSYHDPHVPVFPTMRRHKLSLRSVDLTAEALAASDCVVVVTDHRAVDYAFVGAHASVVVDTRNAMASVVAPAARITKA